MLACLLLLVRDVGAASDVIGVVWALWTRWWWRWGFKRHKLTCFLLVCKNNAIRVALQRCSQSLRCISLVLQTCDSQVKNMESWEHTL